MTIWQNYPSGLVQPDPPTPARPRFSLTSDILSFRKCRRQYGYFGNDGFVPAQAVQIYFGQMIHQVLDRCHRHYSGLLGVPHGTFPTNHDIDLYCDEVDRALRTHGIRPASPVVAAQAREILKTFNAIEGPALYPRVLDTEYPLESDRNNYVLRGVVDVLAGDQSGFPEIWDYKGTDMPPLSSVTMRDYEWQMSVSAELYKAKSGQYPAQAVLYFLNELKTRAGDLPITSRPLRAVYVVDFMRDGVEPDGTPRLVRQGLDQFDVMVQDILTCRTARTWTAPPASDAPDDKTCEICDIRWNCQSATGQFPLRTPML